MIEFVVLAIADALVVLGVLVMTIALYGLAWMPDSYIRLHAASKAAMLGVIPILLATTVTGDLRIIFRAGLVGAFLLLTTPVAAYAMARAALLSKERMHTPGAVDESGRDLARGEEE